MASSKEYAYAIKGNKLTLVEKYHSGGESGLNYTYDADVGIELPRGIGNWKSPRSNVTDGLHIEYTISPGDSIKDESSEIPVPNYLAKSLIYYIKAKFSEQEKDIEAREYYMKLFYKGIEKYNNARIYGARRVSPGNHRIG